MAIAGRPRARQQIPHRREARTPFDEALRTYADALAAAGRPAGSAPTTGKRVLIVGVGAREAFALADALEIRGLEVTFAEDEREAWERLAAPGADLVLVDSAVGGATISAIRTNPVFVALPVIALTPEGAAEKPARCLAAGATGYLERPVDMDGLLPLIRIWLGR